MPQKVARANRGQLINIAHQKQMSARLDRAEQVVGEDQVNHRSLIHHQKIVGKRVLWVEPKALPRLVA